MTFADRALFTVQIFWGQHKSQETDRDSGKSADVNNASDAQLRLTFFRPLQPPQGCNERVSALAEDDKPFM